MNKTRLNYSHMVSSMLTVSKGVLKAKMLEYFRRIEKTKEELIVTDHHRPVLRITPIVSSKLPTEVFGQQNKVIYYEDINTPTTHEWGDL